MKRVHEGLNNYLKSLKTAGDVAVPDLQPRLPLGPDAPIPPGLRPIPTSSQAPKKTNATIVYARTAMNSTREDIMGQIRVHDVASVTIPIEEGQIVFTYRCPPAVRQPMGQTVKAFSLGRVNHILEQEENLPVNSDKRTHNLWCPDGVCNNLDGADPNNEFKDPALANVATQGFVRFSTFGMKTSVVNADRVFVGLRKVGNRWSFERFTSYQITKFNKKNPEHRAWWDSLKKAWQVGRVVDGKQSKNMVTVNVSIDPVAPDPLEKPYKLVPDPKDARKMVAEYEGVRVYTVVQQLMRMWLDASNADLLNEINNDVAVRAATDAFTANVLSRAVEREATDAFTAKVVAGAVERATTTEAP